MPIHPPFENKVVFSAHDYKFPELIQAEIDKDVNRMITVGNENDSWTINTSDLGIIDDNIRSATIDYNYGGKKWKYITILNATCSQIPCEEWAYCLECEEIN